MGRYARTWTWTGLILHQREASSTVCSEERQVLVLRQLSEGVGAKVLALFLLFFLPFSPRALSKSTCKIFTRLKFVVWNFVIHSFINHRQVAWNKATLFPFSLWWKTCSFLHYWLCYFVSHKEFFLSRISLCEDTVTYLKMFISAKKWFSHLLLVAGAAQLAGYFHYLLPVLYYRNLSLCSSVLTVFGLKGVSVLGDLVDVPSSISKFTMLSTYVVSVCYSYFYSYLSQ